MAVQLFMQQRNCQFHSLAFHLPAVTQSRICLKNDSLAVIFTFLTSTGDWLGGLDEFRIN
jgi:hypothetical protein